MDLPFLPFTEETTAITLCWAVNPTFLIMTTLNKLVSNYAIRDIICIKMEGEKCYYTFHTLHLNFYANFGIARL